MEAFHWFSDLLSGHVTDAGMIDGCPIPLYILKKIANDQNMCAGFGEW